MNPRTPSVDTILAEAVEIADPAGRQAFVEKCCAGDAALKARVERLVADHFRAGSFLERPAADLGATGEFTPSEGPAPDAARSAEGPGTVIGPYRLLEQIGEGGMGLVFVAEQQQPVRRRVALKIIKPGMDSRQVVARFEAERQALAMMDHPNIARIYDGGATPAGRPYFVMELVRGTPITDYCDRRRLATRQRLELFLDVCGAVQHAHQKGIIHRDLKPSNVLVEVHDVRPVVKVIDFGIAKAAGQQLTDKTLYTAFAQMIGTPLYMSPEQAGLSSLDVDTRSDVYSLGVLLYELLTGTTPFDAEALRKAGYDEMRRIIREEEPPRPSARLSTLKKERLSTIAEQRGAEPHRLGRHVRGELDWVVMRCLEKDRNRRFESAGALAADVQRFLNDEPVQACPPSLGYRMRKFARRNRGRLAAAALALAVGLVAAVLLGAVYLQGAGRLRQTAQDVREAVAGARTAIEAGNLPLARQRVAEAQGRLGTERGNLAVLASELDQVQKQLTEREADAARCQRFLKLAAEVENLEVEDYEGEQKHAHRIANAEEALGVYGVLTDDEWVASLESAYLTPGQKQEVREAAYVVLVYLADYRVRWLFDDPKIGADAAERGLELLRRAQSFHEPTRAFYFVRAECQLQQGRAAAAEEDERRYKEMVGRTAWDYFLPGRSAAWARHYEEAERSYLAALRVQPNHYLSLYFLAYLMSTGDPKIDRLPEAVQLYTACIALRPDSFDAYMSRGACRQRLGKLDDAEADYTTALALAEAKVGPDHLETLLCMDRLATTRSALGRHADALKLHEEIDRALEEIKAKLGPARADPLLSHFYLARGQRFAVRGDWDQAAANFARAFNRQPPNPSYLWLTYACLCLQIGDRAGYHTLCEQMLKRYGESGGVDDVAFLAHVCLLAPDALGDAALTLRLAERRLAMTLPPSGHRAWSLRLMGLAYYRAGQDETAINWLHKALDEDPDWELRGINWLLLAMAYQRMGKTDEARRWFEKAEGWIEEKSTAGSGQSEGFTPPGFSWTDWLQVQLLRNEAREVLAIAPKKASSTGPAQPKP